MIRCLLFDLGETLWTRKDQTTWTKLGQESQQRALALLREHFAPHMFPSNDGATLGQQIEKAIGQQSRQMIIANPDGEPDSIQATIRALQELGFPSIEPSFASTIFESLRIRIPSSRALFPDILPTLKELQQRGFLLGVVTNRQHGGPLFLEDMRALGLLDYFAIPHVAVSADLRIRKPNATIFMHALNALNVAPEEAAMVGDSLRADVAGAQNLGIFAVWKPKPKLMSEVRASLAPGVEVVDDDYLLAQAYGPESKKYQKTLGDIKPDWIIEHLSELLDVFIKAGRQ
jgi:HAD superfamily hydrolase (TIGR01549 family)